MIFAYISICFIIINKLEIVIMKSFIDIFNYQLILSLKYIPIKIK